MVLLKVNSYLWFYDPILNIPFLSIKVYTNFYYRLATSRKTLAVLLEVDLLHGGLGTLVEFQFDEIESILSLHHYIHPSIRCVNLHIHHKVSQEGEDDEKHLLVMPLVIGIVTIRHRAQELLEQAQGSIHVALANQDRHLGDCHISLLGIHAFQIIRQKALK